VSAMDRRQTWLEATEAHGDPLILEAVIGEAGRVHFVGDLPDGFRFLRGAFIDLGFEHYPEAVDVRGIARAVVGTGVLVPDTPFRIRTAHTAHTCVEPAYGSETAALPREWKQFVVVIGNDDRWSWVGKRVTPERTGGVDLSKYQDDGDGWALKVSERPPHEVQLFGG
jgi:hypothetical protein